MNKPSSRMLSLYTNIDKIRDFRVHDGNVYLLMRPEDLVGRICMQQWGAGIKMNRIMAHALAQRIKENAKPIEGGKK